MKRVFSKSQQGFTLLELLVVITLLAVLAVGALVAYEDVGANAEATAAANSNVTIDSAIRTFRSVTGGYPNQWDSLSTTTGAAISTLPVAGSAVFGNLTLNASAATALEDAFDAVGIDEIQYMTAVLPNGIAPNRAHNESANPGASVEVATAEFSAGAANFKNISIVPSGGLGGTCAFEGTSIDTPFNGTALNNNSLLNGLNDSLEGDECHLVVALGFGGDAAASTTNSNVAISQAPTYTRAGTVNPATNYARYVGLFHVGADDGTGLVATARTTARLIAVIGPDGRTIDESIAAAQPTAN